VFVDNSSHGSAVVQAKGVRAICRSYERPRNSTLCRSETVELIKTKFCIIDYVAETRKVPILVAIGHTCICVKYNVCVPFVFLISRFPDAYPPNALRIQNILILVLRSSAATY
jgi:hypothetical protein